MTTPKQSVPAPLKVAVFLKLGAVRLAMVLIVFLIFWGTGWVPVATAAQIAGLLGLRCSFRRRTVRVPAS